MTTPEQALLDAVVALRSEAAALTGTDDALLGHGSVVEAAGRVIDGMRTRFAVEADRRSDRALGEQGLARRHGHHTGAQLVEQVTGTSAAKARQRIRVGEATTPRTSDTGLPLPPLFPEVGAALEAGRIDLDAADLITKELGKASKRAPVEHLEAAERTLVAEAIGTETGAPKSADLIGTQARLWRDALDPDGIEPRADEAFTKRGVTVSKVQRDGLHAIRGHVTPEVAGQIFMLSEAIFTPKSAPKFVPPAPCGCGDIAGAADGSNDGDAPGCDCGATGVTGADADGGRPKETRSIEQQLHDLIAAAVSTLAKTSKELTVAGAAPTVLITVQAEALEQDIGTGTMVGLRDAVPLSTVKQTMCDGITQRVLLGKFGEVVAMETEQRLFTRKQRLAIIARDGPTCFCCQIPAIATEAHHVVEWANGGKTRIDNGVMLCYADHRAAERGEIGFEFIRGKPRLIVPEWRRRMLAR